MSAVKLAQDDPPILAAAQANLGAVLQRSGRPEEVCRHVKYIANDQRTLGGPECISITLVEVVAAMLLLFVTWVLEKQNVEFVYGGKEGAGAEMVRHADVEKRKASRAQRLHTYEHHLSSPTVLAQWRIKVLKLSLQYPAENVMLCVRSGVYIQLQILFFVFMPP